MGSKVTVEGYENNVNSNRDKSGSYLRFYFLLQSLWHCIINVYLKYECKEQL